MVLLRLIVLFHYFVLVFNSFRRWNFCRYSNRVKLEAERFDQLELDDLVVHLLLSLCSSLCLSLKHFIYIAIMVIMFVDG